MKIFYSLPVLLGSALMLVGSYVPSNGAQNDSGPAKGLDQANEPSSIAGSAQIKGKLENQEHAPAAYSTVSVFTTDSVFVKGTVSDVNGLFLVENLNGGTYYLHVRNLEYQDFKSAPFKLKDKEVKEFAPITLKPSELLLNQVEVYAERALVEMHPNKLVFNVANTANAIGNNGLEVLAKAPGVIIDLDNNIILQGKSGVKIYINGRPSRLSGEDLVNLLQGMQSDNIQSIEIITNPGAQYEAEGNAGIIDIKLKSNPTLGYNGTLYSSASQGTFPRMSHGGSLNYGKGKIGANLNLNRFDAIHQIDFDSHREQYGNKMDMLSFDKNGVTGYHINGGLDYEFNKKHVLGFTGFSMLSRGDHSGNSTTEIQRDQGQDQVLYSEARATSKSNNFNYGLNYRWNLTKDTRLSADLTVGSYDMNKSTRQPNTYYSWDRQTVNESNTRIYEPFTTISMQALKGDMETKLGKINWSSGVKFSTITTSNDFNVYREQNGTRVRDTNQSNTFTYTEQVSAGYFTASRNLGKDLKAEVGLRAEYTTSEGILLSQKPTSDDSVTRTYMDYFPSLSLAWTMNKQSSWSLSMGRRITRPNYQDLNPFESGASELNTWKGNPFLRPNYIMNYQLSYSHNRRLVITNTFSRTKDFFANLVEIRDSTSSIIIPRNMDRALDNGLSISYPWHVSDNLDLYNFFLYNWSSYKGSFSYDNIQLNTHIFNARIQGVYKFARDWALDATATWNSPFVWRGSIRVEGYWGLDLGVKKAFFNDKLQMKLSANDLFNTMSDYTYLGDYGGMKTYGVVSFDRHRYGINLSYNFGNKKIGQRKRSSGLEEELKRISSE